MFPTSIKRKSFSGTVYNFTVNETHLYVVNGMVVSKQSNYFIKNKSNYSNETLVNMINEIKMTAADYSVGPKSISKKELMNYILKEERQKAGFDFEVIVEKLFTTRSPPASSQPASIPPSITKSAPAQNALLMSHGLTHPPSLITYAWSW